MIRLRLGTIKWTNPSLSLVLRQEKKPQSDKTRVLSQRCRDPTQRCFIRPSPATQLTTLKMEVLERGCLKRLPHFDNYTCYMSFDTSLNSCYRSMISCGVMRIFLVSVKCLLCFTTAIATCVLGRHGKNSDISCEVGTWWIRVEIKSNQ